ncbi:MAG: hypothetical protein QOH25_2765 [Acidobacteriota bacterium]|jgi:hypothetical protein|nr:hypothetical protein [Acidobacteriota bacterium]
MKERQKEKGKSKKFGHAFSVIQKLNIQSREALSDLLPFTFFLLP